MATRTTAEAPRASSWVSQGLEVLEAGHDGKPFDVLIVGSGYGGAVAADRLAGCTDSAGQALRIAVLERGREYLRGAFPRSLADLAGHVRFTTPGAGHAAGRLEGLFDIRVGADMSVLVANGVGGGSLINAGVMLFPEAGVFEQPPWPKALKHAALRKRADRLAEDLGAKDNGIDDTFTPPIARRAAMRSIDPGSYHPVPVTIALSAGQRTVAGVALEKCIACGDCVTGCNHGAKNSLDLNLLRRAQRRGVAVYSGATVSRLRRCAGDAEAMWELEVWHTDQALRRRMAGALVLKARRVILAAGTLGSTEILLRSQSPQLAFSPLLGRRFSGNGDVLAALYDGSARMNAAADEAQQPSKREVGPTITGMLDWRSGDPAAARCLVQDLGVPGALRRVLGEVTATTDLLHRLDRRDTARHDPQQTGADTLAVSEKRVAHTTVVAIIAHDAADGRLRAIEPKTTSELDAGLDIDPGLHIDWPGARDDPRIRACHERLASALKNPGSIGGRLLPNPAWQPFPPSLDTLLGTTRGPLLSVHPLGGCAMGSGRHDGVVDSLGRVFDGNAAKHRRRATHPGLVVLDGSIIPTSLGVNPSLTIATLADRAIVSLIRRVWKLDRPAPPPAQPERRPVFVRNTDTPLAKVPTCVEVVERLTGLVDIEGARFFVELSLAYKDFAVPVEDTPADGTVIEVDTASPLSRLRVFADASPPADNRIHPLVIEQEEKLARQIRDRPDAHALLIVPIESGTLRFLHREASGELRRLARGLLAYFGNRGLRDIHQAISENLAGVSDTPLSIGLRIRQMLAVASRAGEARRFDYKLQLGAPLGPGHPALASWARSGGRQLAGHKRLSYERRCSPWTQLMRLELSELGGLRLGAKRQLELSLSHLARMQVPLLRIRDQRSLPDAYADLACFAMFVARILLNVHLWSFRQPDRQIARRPNRLPQPLPGLPAPRIHRIDAGGNPAAKIRLTVYPKPGASRPPVMMVHGYSANGTTFAHPSLPCSLAQHLWQQGAEPWVLDLRSSSGMPTAQHPWAFEDMAEHDIPAAIEFVCAATAQPRIDVVTHCMGSAMLAMGLLGPDGVSQRIRPRLRRWVMTQVTPKIVFAPANLLRAYLMQYVLNLLPSIEYPIGGVSGPAGIDGNAFDRFMSALPYLGEGRDSEFDVENPPWWRFWQHTPWVRTRHRLDALFGRVFDARNLSPATLSHIDDFFGEISLQTVSQTIHMARNVFISDRFGSSEVYWDDAHRARLEGLPMLSLHARDSGLADWETGLEFAARMCREPGLPPLQHEALMVENCSHQDLLIGKNAMQVFKHIDRFLQRS